LGIPVVQFLRRLERVDVDHVGADFRLGMTLATEHLIRLGHRRIAFVGAGRRASPAKDRSAAYRATLARHGLAPGPVIRCLPTREEGCRAVGQIFQGEPTDPTAVLCYNDICAFGVMSGLADRGLVPGRDVAVVGFDNIVEAALHRPALSTVAIGARQIGEEAANLLLRRIASPKGPPEIIVLPPKLMVRSSCGGQPMDQLSGAVQTSIISTSDNQGGTTHDCKQDVDSAVYGYGRRDRGPFDGRGHLR
jgi:LacI family transcriptional regulator